MAKIDILSEQTEFLLEKQKEVLEVFKSEFASLYELLEAEQAKAEQSKSGEELMSFQKVFTLLSNHEKESVTDLEEDVEFLKEQVAAINKIKQLEDEKQADELVGMMLEEGYELEESKSFKADVEQEAEEAKEGFRSMIKDIKATLVEEGVGDLEKLLEAHKAACEDAECKAQECADEECKDEECCGSSCHTCPGCNIFEGLESETDKKEEE